MEIRYKRGPRGETVRGQLQGQGYVEAEVVRNAVYFRMQNGHGTYLASCLTAQELLEIEQVARAARVRLESNRHNCANTVTTG